jgi:hypothetical protein
VLSIPSDTVVVLTSLHMAAEVACAAGHSYCLNESLGDDWSAIQKCSRSAPL